MHTTGFDGKTQNVLVLTLIQVCLILGINNVVAGDSSFIGLLSISLQVEIAERQGALGIIIFSDPADYTWAAEDARVYPETWWLPPSGAQRGTTFVGSGDPLTPYYPAIGNF